VILDTFGSVVTPTASESMLKPRLENKPEILERTPAWFSTSIDKVYCITTPH